MYWLKPYPESFHHLHVCLHLLTALNHEQTITADGVTTSVAMWSGVSFDVSSAKKQKGGGCRKRACLWWKNGGSPKPWPVGGQSLWGALVPYGRGCRGQREEAAALTPTAVVVIVGASAPRAFWRMTFRNASTI